MRIFFMHFFPIHLTGLKSRFHRLICDFDLLFATDAQKVFIRDS